MGEVDAANKGSNPPQEVIRLSASCDIMWVTLTTYTWLSPAFTKSITVLVLWLTAFTKSITVLVLGKGNVEINSIYKVYHSFGTMAENKGNVEINSIYKVYHSFGTMAENKGNVEINSIYKVYHSFGTMAENRLTAFTKSITVLVLWLKTKACRD